VRRLGSTECGFTVSAESYQPPRAPALPCCSPDKDAILSVEANEALELTLDSVDLLFEVDEDDWAREANDVDAETEREVEDPPVWGGGDKGEETEDEIALVSDWEETLRRGDGVNVAGTAPRIISFNFGFDTDTEDNLFLTASEDDAGEDEGGKDTDALRVPPPPRFTSPPPSAPGFTAVPLPEILETFTRGLTMSLERSLALITTASIILSISASSSRFRRSRSLSCLTRSISSSSRSCARSRSRCAIASRSRNVFASPVGKIGCFFAPDLDVDDEVDRLDMDERDVERAGEGRILLLMLPLP
jgi:hypothetical protein